MSTTREQAGPSKPWDSATEEKEKDNRTFECNICLDTAKDAVISMCGHLFWYDSYNDIIAVSVIDICHKVHHHQIAQ